jgi:hypothetical protein
MTPGPSWRRLWLAPIKRHSVRKAVRPRSSNAGFRGLIPISPNIGSKVSDASGKRLDPGHTARRRRWGRCSFRPGCGRPRQGMRDGRCGRAASVRQHADWARHRSRIRWRSSGDAAARSRSCKAAVRPSRFVGEPPMRRWRRRRRCTEAARTRTSCYRTLLGALRFEAVRGDHGRGSRVSRGPRPARCGDRATTG